MPPTPPGAWSIRSARDSGRGERPQVCSTLGAALRELPELVEPTLHVAASARVFRAAETAIGRPDP
jgi:hypothetical protein